MNKTEAISLVRQQHVLDEYAEKQGMRERLFMLIGIISLGCAIGFLISDIYRHHYTVRSVKNLVVLFAVGLLCCWQSRQCGRDRLALAAEAQKIRSQQQPVG